MAFSFNYGGGTAAPAPATPGFGFASGSSAGAVSVTPPFYGAAPSPGALGMAAPPPPAAPPQPRQLLQVPDYESTFRGEAVWNKVRDLVNHSLQTGSASSSSSSTSSSLAGQELVEILRCDNSSSSTDDSMTAGSFLLASCQVQAYAAPNHQLRQQLAQNQIQVMLYDNQQEAALTPALLQQVLCLADDLRVSEQDAFCLFARASVPSHRQHLVQVVTTSTTSSSSSSSDTSSNTELLQNIPLAAREMYFYEQRLPLQTLLLLFTSRLHEEGNNNNNNNLLLVQATDQLLQEEKGGLLVGRLVKLILDYSSRIEEMLHERERLEAMASTATMYPYHAAAASTTTAMTAQDADYHHKQQLVQVHLDYMISERQTAAQILFFIAYHTQLTGKEVASLVDLIQELTNYGRLPILDPFLDIPSPYEQPSQPLAPDWMHTAAAMHTTTTLREKDPLVWQRELVQQTCHQTAHAPLLRCVGILVAAVMSALDAQAVLVDRTTHQPQTFGMGNALLPPNTLSTDGLVPIHSRLTKAAEAQWERPDILGVLLASYALLLRSAPAAFLSSPSSGSSSISNSTIDIRKSWRECLEAPTELRSFTFARLGLLPALRGVATSIRHASLQCDASEFLLSVVANFAARYLDVLSTTPPISRSQWEQDAEEDLRLRRVHQEHDRQFQQWSGTRGSSSAAATVPSSVDLLARPDCMDDVVAFCVAVGSLGSNYALMFWSRQVDVDSDDDREKLVPTRALQELNRQQQADHSLLPCYLSFLAALALAKDPTSFELDGATVIHQMLSSSSSSSSKSRLDSSDSQVTWASLTEILRWYARELGPQDYGRASTSASSSTQSTSAPSSSAYYYSYDAQQSAAASSAYGENQESSLDDRPKTRELGDDNTFILLSHLSLISNVSAACAAARLEILETKLPVQGALSSEVIGQDSTLMILYSLALTPLTPEVRGSVFSTLAYLLCKDGANAEQAAKIEEVAITAWHLLDEFHILPIGMLEQYPSSSVMGGSRSLTGISFPPSSTALVVEKAGKSWIPANPVYSILYEMEYVESAKGFYPSTEGFLRLLRSLFVTAGSPHDVGRHWRQRRGCTPYVEYALRLVLPRVLGRFPNVQTLPFYSSVDRDRLITAALEVLEVTLTRYTLPIKNPSATLLEKKNVDQNHCLALRAAEDMLGQTSLAADVIAEPSVADANLFNEDWVQKPIPGTESSESTWLDGAPVVIPGLPAEQPPIATPRALSPSVPRSKSPALSVLADVLSSGEGYLLDSIIYVLRDAKRSVEDGLAADAISLTFALFNGTPPTFASAKAGTKKAGLSLQSLLQSLRTSPSKSTYYGAIHWKERATLQALNILCAVLVREESLQKMVDSLPGKHCVVPVLQFRHKTTSSRLEVFDLQLSKLAPLLLSSNADTGVLFSIIDLIGYSALSEEHDVAIARASAAVVLYVDKSLPHQQSITHLYEGGQEGEGKVSSAFGLRLVVSSGRMSSKPDAELARLILTRMLVELRPREPSAACLAFALLGLSTRQHGAEAWKQGYTSAERPKDCFDALLVILKDERFATSPLSSELAANCFEVLFRLLKLAGADEATVRRVSYTSDRLRSVDFWRSHLSSILANFVSSSHTLLSDEHVLHSIAWLLKSTAIELQLLGSSTFRSPQPVQYANILSFLFETPHEILVYLIRLLPIERVDFNVDVFPSEIAVRGAMMQLQGAPEVIQGYQVIGEARLIEISEQSGSTNVDALQAWANEWNRSIVRDCATAHLSDAIHLVLGSSAIGNAQSTMHTVRIGGNNVLAVLLDRMTSRGRNIDELYFTTATRNLSLAAMVAAKIAVAEIAVTGPTNTSIDIPAACALVARAIALSGSPGNVGTDGDRKNERTAVLATAFSILLKYASVLEFVESASDLHDFIFAAIVLTRLACCSSHDQSISVPSQEALVARSCLGFMLEVFENETRDASGYTFLQAVLLAPYEQASGSTNALALVNLVASLDWSVTELLQKIVLLPGGGKILLDNRILAALISASQTYVAEESKVMASQNTVSYQELNIAVPQFFQGHLRLLSELMTIDAPEDCLRNVASETMNILMNYGPVMERLFLRFPIDGEISHDLARCLMGARMLLPSKNFFSTIGTAARNSSFEAFERHFAAVTLHIAENPLPRNLLPALPACLGVDGPVESSAVSVAITSEKSWWDSLDTKTTASSTSVWPRARLISEDTYAYAVVGADILRCGLYIFRDKMSSSTFNSRPLARALCRCADALTAIDSTDRSAWSLNAGEVTADGNEKKLQGLLGDAVTTLLILMLHHARQAKKGDYSSNESRAEIRRNLSAALDHSRLDVTRINNLGSSFSDENGPDYVMELVRLIKAELEIPVY